MGHFSRLAALAILLCTAGLSRADYFQDIGYTALKNNLGAATPTGAGVQVTQVEANENSVNYLPDTSSAEFTGKTFTTLSGSSGVSGHATLVGQYFYGIYTSIAPGITSIANYSANGWVGSGFLNTGNSFFAPKVETRKIQNHSWIGSGSSDQEILRRFDYAISRDDFLAVVGLNNGSTVRRAHS